MRIKNPDQLPIKARHVELSLISSADDEPGRPTDRLLAIAIDAAEHARTLSLSDVSERLVQPPHYPDIWPGEHYRLLAGLVRTLNPSTIVEIGTGSGLSALCAKKFLRNDGRIVSFDLKHWTTDSNTVLREEDFADERLFQLTDDLSNPLVFPLHLDLLRTAELIFVDAAKDGVSETRILEHLSTITFHTPPIVVLDDIRLWNMLRIWRDISRPKLDVTSFGHWSGTGLIEWR